MTSANATTKRPKVYPINLFEVRRNAAVPDNKTQLVQMLKSKHAIPFHEKVCIENNTLLDLIENKKRES
jgi:hypothetical protein